MTRARLGGTIPTSSNSNPKHREQPEAVNSSNSSLAMLEVVLCSDALEIDFFLPVTSCSVVGPSISRHSDDDPGGVFSEWERKLTRLLLLTNPTDSGFIFVTAEWIPSSVLYAVRNL